MRSRHCAGERAEVYEFRHEYTPIVDLLEELAAHLHDFGIDNGYLLGFQSTCSEDGWVTTLTVG